MEFSNSITPSSLIESGVVEALIRFNRVHGRRRAAQRGSLRLCFLSSIVAAGLASILGVSVAIAQAEAPPTPTEAEIAPPSGASEPDGAAATEPDAELEREELVIDAPDPEIEEISVVGTRAEGVAQDAPISAVQFGAVDIQREQINDLRDLSSYTPNLEIKTAFAASNPVLFIRGVGLDDFNANSASAVAVYQDGIYMNSPAGQLFQFFDTAQIEVLRGPQAGQYRNASAGAILVTSQKPTDALEGYARFSYGNFNAIDVEGALSGPIPTLKEYLSGRVAFRIQNRDGITKNRCGDQELAPLTSYPPACLEIPFQDSFPDYHLGGLPQVVKDPVNDVDQWAVRGLLELVAPVFNTETEWLLNAHGGRSRGLAAQYQQRGFQKDDPEGEKIPGWDGSDYEDVDGDPFAGDYNFTGPEDLDLWGVSLQGLWNAGGAYEITSTSGYEWHDRYILENSDANPRNLLAIEYNDTAWQFSQELQLENHWTENVDSAIGAYFFTESLDVFNVFDTPQSNINFDQEFSQDTRSFAFFALGTWTFLSDFKLEPSIRYTWEHKDFELVSRAFTRRGGLSRSLEGRESETFKGPSGSLSLTYYLTDENSVYARYTRGWKPGHFNGGAVFSGQLIEPVRPETVDAIEGGVRTLWFDERVQFNATGFYYQYTDMQIFQLEQDSRGFPVQQLINAESVAIVGFEIDLYLRPFEGLDVSYNLGWLESEYEEFASTILHPVPTPPGAPKQVREINIDYSGNRLIGSPTLAMAGIVEYTWPVWRNLGWLIPRVSFSYKDDVFFDPAEGKGAIQDLPDGTIGQEAYWLLHAGLLWRSPGERFEISGWVRNITNKEYRVQSFDVTTRPFQFVLDIYGEPRTYGFTVSAYF
jgi:iron complex outermembrane receptor protein